MSRIHRRREPLSRFILTLGMADMVIGGVGDRFSLFLLGLATAGVGLVLRWARLKTRQPLAQPLTLGPKAPRALPPASTARRTYRERRIY